MLQTRSLPGGGRGTGLASLEMWHVANKVPSWGRKREEWVSELGNVARCKMGTHLLEGRKREERVGELRNMGGGKRGMHMGGGRRGGGGEGAWRRETEQKRR